MGAWWRFWDGRSLKGGGYKGQKLEFVGGTGECARYSWEGVLVIILYYILRYPAVNITAKIIISLLACARRDVLLPAR